MPLIQLNLLFNFFLMRFVVSIFIGFKIVILLIMNKLTSISFVLFFFIFSCGTSKKVEKTIEQPIIAHQPIEIKEKKTFPNERALYQASETKVFDLVHTKLDVRFDWEKSYLHGVATITVKPHFYKQDTLVLDAKGMDIHSVKMNNQPLNYTYAKDFLIIQLNRSFTRDEKLTVVIDYTAKPDERETGGSAAITSDKGLYFINPKGEDPTKMPQIWTQGETEANSVWFPTIDAPNQKMTQEILITVDDKFVTLSNGLLVQSKKNADGTRTDHWKQDLPHVPYLAMMGVGEFKITKDNFTRKDGSKIEVNYFVEPEYNPYAKAIFGNTPEMIGFFSELLGVEYPWDKYHQIVVRDYVSGAMENTGAVIFGDFVYMTDRELLDANSESIIAHELFHHWFGDLVTCESWSNLPLNESFANYSQFLWDEYKHGLDEAEYQAENEANGYFQTVQYQGMHNMIWFDYDNKEQMFDGHSYNKGGRILHMLRNYIGDEAFFKSLNYYLKRHAYKPAEIHELRLAFEEITGEDLNWFFNQWFFAQGHPVLDVKHTVNAGVLELTIEQKQNFEDVPLYKLPMKLSVFDGDKRKDYSIVVDKMNETFSFPITNELNSYIIDADHVILAEWKENKTAEQYLYQFYKGGKYADRRDGLAGAAKLKTEEARRMILDALNDPFYRIRELAIAQSNRVKRTHESELKSKMLNLVLTDPKSSVRAAALEFLLANFADDNATKNAILTCLEKDQSYKVLGVALNGLAKTDSEKAMILAKQFETETSQSMLANIASLYAKYGDVTHFSFFDRIFKEGKVGGFTLLGVVASFGNYVKRSDYEIQSRALSIFTDLSKVTTGYMSYVLPNVLNSIHTAINDRIVQQEKIAEELDKTGEPARADKIRKAIKSDKELLNAYSELL
jgi:aminopeptidase N